MSVLAALDPLFGLVAAPNRQMQSPRLGDRFLKYAPQVISTWGACCASELSQGLKVLGTPNPGDVKAVCGAVSCQIPGVFFCDVVFALYVLLISIIDHNQMK